MKRQLTGTFCLILKSNVTPQYLAQADDKHTWPTLAPLVIYCRNELSKFQVHCEPALKHMPLSLNNIH